VHKMGVPIFYQGTETEAKKTYANT
jgi:hypothetical protein